MERLLVERERHAILLPRDHEACFLDKSTLALYHFFVQAWSLVSCSSL